MIEFFGELDLRLIHSGSKVPTKAGRVQWNVLTDTEPHCVWRGATIYLERGGETDLASIPRLAWTLLPPDGAWVRAAIWHDALYARKGDVARIGHPEPFSRAEADRLFRDGMKACGVSRLKRQAIWSAVRAGGGSGWGS